MYREQVIKYKCSRYDSKKAESLELTVELYRKSKPLKRTTNVSSSVYSFEVQRKMKKCIENSFKTKKVLDTIPKNRNHSNWR